MRATARVVEVDANTVLQWLREAADQLQAFSRYFLCDVHVRQVQLDELYAGCIPGSLRVSHGKGWRPLWGVSDPRNPRSAC